jgi:hypothetical protein
LWICRGGSLVPPTADDIKVGARLYWCPTEGALVGPWTIVDLGPTALIDRDTGEFFLLQITLRRGDETKVVSAESLLEQDPVFGSDGRWQVRSNERRAWRR